ncbi:MAG TPA: DUF4282 domain-containing protein [Pseudonocardiaceae bacterium]|jgi:hypothetical protein|nr:DUF4282 domain-containing protein [Pseudonocardiaceae bacterium]
MTYNPPPSGWPGQPQPAQPPGPPPAAQQQAGFFSALFDFSFTRFVTPSVIRVLYALGFILIVLVYLAYLVFAFLAYPGLGLVVLLIGWIVPLLYLALWRVMLEFFLAVVRMSEDIHHRGSVR